MNERIQELIKQAQINDLAIDTNGDLYDVKRLDPEKFAELIVRECANIANGGLDPNEDYLIGDDILEHFGVEE